MKDIAIEVFAQDISRTRQTVYNLFEKSVFEPVMFDRILQKLRMTKGEFEGYESNIIKEAQGIYKVKTKGIPFFPDYARAGKGQGFSDEVHADLPMYYVPGFQDCDLMVPVSGDSMYNDYSSGDIIICKRLEGYSFIQWGNTHLVDTPQGLLLKILLPSDKPKHIKFVSKNEKYPPFDVPEKEIKKVWIVKGKIKKNLI